LNGNLIGSKALAIAKSHHVRLQHGSEISSSAHCRVNLNETRERRGKVDAFMSSWIHFRSAHQITVMRIGAWPNVTARHELLVVSFQRSEKASYGEVN
jgi:hypothetical protein